MNHLMSTKYGLPPLLHSHHSTFIRTGLC